MIELTNVCKSYGDKKIFDNFNLKIDDNDYVIFSGNSGCGKTTLLNMIGSIESLDSGKIIVDGIDISNKKNQFIYFRTKVGFLFQNFALIENKTVNENLKMIKKSCASGISIEEALKRVGLADKIDQKVYTLSGGEQQRIALARLMIKKCDIILADEPTGSLDKDNAKIVLDILDDFYSSGKTIILVTHYEDIKKSGRKVVELCPKKMA